MEKLRTRLFSKFRDEVEGTRCDSIGLDYRRRRGEDAFELA